MLNISNITTLKLKVQKNLFIVWFQFMGIGINLQSFAGCHIQVCLINSGIVFSIFYFCIFNYLQNCLMLIRSYFMKHLWSNIKYFILLHIKYIWSNIFEIHLICREREFNYICIYYQIFFGILTPQKLLRVNVVALSFCTSFSPFSLRFLLLIFK